MVSNKVDRSDLRTGHQNFLLGLRCHFSGRPVACIAGGIHESVIFDGRAPILGNSWVAKPKVKFPNSTQLESLIPSQLHHLYSWLRCQNQSKSSKGLGTKFLSVLPHWNVVLIKIFRFADLIFSKKWGSCGCLDTHPCKLFYDCHVKY